VVHPGEDWGFRYRGLRGRIAANEAHFPAQGVENAHHLGCPVGCPPPEYQTAPEQGGRFRNQEPGAEKSRAGRGDEADANERLEITAWEVSEAGPDQALAAAVVFLDGTDFHNRPRTEVDAQVPRGPAGIDHLAPAVAVEVGHRAVQQLGALAPV